MGHTEHYYRMQEIINRGYQNLAENKRRWNEMLEKMQRGEWGDDDEDNYQSSNNHSKGDYYGNRW